MHSVPRKVRFASAVERFIVSPRPSSASAEWSHSESEDDMSLEDLCDLRDVHVPEAPHSRPSFRRSSSEGHEEEDGDLRDVVIDDIPPHRWHLRPAPLQPLQGEYSAEVLSLRYPTQREIQRRLLDDRRISSVHVVDRTASQVDPLPPVLDEGGPDGPFELAGVEYRRRLINALTRRRRLIARQIRILDRLDDIQSDRTKLILPCNVEPLS